MPLTTGEQAEIKSWIENATSNLRYDIEVMMRDEIAELRRVVMEERSGVDQLIVRIARLIAMKDF